MQSRTRSRAPPAEAYRRQLESNLAEIEEGISANVLTSKKRHKTYQINKMLTFIAYHEL